MLTRMESRAPSGEIVLMYSPEWSPGPQVEKYSSSARLNGVQGPEWIATACDVGVAPELLAGELQHLPARQLGV